MATFEAIAERIMPVREELCTRFGVRVISVFGSVARGDDTGASDVDLLVEFQLTPTLILLADLQEFLAGVLGRPVDLATAGSLKPPVRERALQKARRVA